MWIAKPTICCASTDGVGIRFTVFHIKGPAYARCRMCGHHRQILGAEGGPVFLADVRRLRKWLPEQDVVDVELMDEEIGADLRQLVTTLERN